MIVFKIRISFISVLWLVTKSGFSGNRNLISINPSVFPLEGKSSFTFFTNAIGFMEGECVNNKHSIDHLICSAGRAHPLPTVPFPVDE